MLFFVLLTRFRQFDKLGYRSLTTAYYQERAEGSGPMTLRQPVRKDKVPTPAREG